MSTFNGLGLKAINTVGHKFDPSKHEALMRQHEEGTEDNIILQQYQKGYTLNDKVLRPSKVIVNKKPVLEPKLEPKPQPEETDIEENAEAKKESDNQDNTVINVPTYDYVCENCNHKFEEFQSITANPLKKCPNCKKMKLKRLIGAGAGVIFKGTGFYETDYRSSSYKDAAKRDSEPTKKTDIKKDNKTSDSKKTSETKPKTIKNSK
jgi:putative FmdB family regulatory protein